MTDTTVTGATVADPSALADTLNEIIECFRDEVGDGFDSDDLAWAITPRPRRR
ncbi:hypothetical protein [Streptomyces sp. NPDC097619]|uniref:hypothetical protein n=1 Tax=Streptomyces sp. NPDC097619 TaxID=3157228 RepID=UPI00331DD34B